MLSILSTYLSISPTCLFHLLVYFTYLSISTYLSMSTYLSLLCPLVFICLSTEFTCLCLYVCPFLCLSIVFCPFVRSSAAALISASRAQTPCGIAGARLKNTYDPSVLRRRARRKLTCGRRGAGSAAGSTFRLVCNRLTRRFFPLPRLSVVIIVDCRSSRSIVSHGSDCLEHDCSESPRLC
ncbi:hypothetical protein EJF18_30300 [Clavispora lusitaniae]|uniref:Uncharacterized protein n=1 Tax=Clavispora lusitaniae TaxID=36911 RepID=A0ACD0WJC7_CLALS|nr:hypothetical protein EJF14_30300 [Clavispora lusitaniae]QFZ33361.1 hypothetical protein EJF16_30300 [Clavispora lusitaniae]QFZ39032.1 hypothetical protein EJF15_30300 [Clavispora lusitaniae]QFZ44714.1 hypothetical protein EJF18_30300 [Clavispora lusitaniae]QFZ50391.1 hypothetical protein EJF17_30300 [Clavispora lusitaniae]